MFDWIALHIPVPTTLALALVATLGYFVGRLRRQGTAGDLRSRRELRRAQGVAKELERIAWVIRQNLSRHHARLTRFKERMGAIGGEHDASWNELCLEANEMLTPTLRLAGQIATAYDQIRQQSNQLMDCAEVRTDALTGLANRRGLEDALAGQFALRNRYGDQFSVVLFDIDHFKDINDQQGHVQGDRVLQQVGRVLEELARETDVVGRFGGEEFLALLPRTDLPGATIFAERVRARIEQDLPLTLSAGLTSVLDVDTADAVVERLQAALVRAKAGGRNCVYSHSGEAIEPVGAPAPCL